MKEYAITEAPLRVTRLEPPASKPGKRNVQLDVLRGVAILLVLGAHCNLPLPSGLVGSLGGLWYRYGPLGVDLFFVLSGFLVGGLLLAEHSKHGRVDVPRFLIRRGLKIYPLYFVFLGYLTAMPVLKAVAAGQDVGAVLAGLWSAYWPNLLFLQNYVGTNPAAHTWSLAVEEHFYILLPLAVFALASAGRIRAVIVLAACAVPAFIGARWLALQLGDPYTVRMLATHLRIDALIFGVGIRGVAEYYPGAFARCRPWRMWLAVAGLALWVPVAFSRELGRIYQTIGVATTMLGSAAFLLAAYHTRGSDFGRWAQPVGAAARAVAFAGVYSYGIYVWHVTIIRILERVVAARIGQAVGQGVLFWTLGVLVVTVGAIAGGAAISRLVELPVLKIRDRWFPSRTSGALPVNAEAGGR